MSCKYRPLRAGLAVAALISVLTAAKAQAEVLVAAVQTNAAVFGGATYFVDFNGPAAGGTEFTFTTSAPSSRVVILFNAECAVEGIPTRWVNIDILVDPAGPTGETAAPPSNSDNAFCSGNGTTTASSSDFTLDGWVSAATIATVVLPQAGTHRVRVRVDGTFSGVARLDDMSLIVMR